MRRRRAGPAVSRCREPSDWADEQVARRVRAQNLHHLAPRRVRVGERTREADRPPGRGLAAGDRSRRLVDNALDEAEEAGVPPVIEIAVEPGSITISDSGPRHPGRDGREADRLFRPHIEPRGLCVADPWRAGQCAADDHRHAVRARPRGLRDGGDREPRRRASHRLRHRSDPPDAQAGDRAARLSGKKRDAPHGPVAGFSKLNSGRGQARFLTTRRNLHLAQPAFEPFPDLERR